MVLFDLKQIQAKIIPQILNKIDVKPSIIPAREEQKNLAKENNRVDSNKRIIEQREKTPCFSKVKSHKEFRVANKKLFNKENEETKPFNESNGSTSANNMAIVSSNLVNVPKTKSTKLNDIKSFARNYRSPSPIITTKTRAVLTNPEDNKIRGKFNSNDINTVPFTPVKHDAVSNINNMNNSKQRSNNLKTPKLTDNKSSITSYPWYP